MLRVLSIMLAAMPAQALAQQPHSVSGAPVELPRASGATTYPPRVSGAQIAPQPAPAPPVPQIVHGYRSVPPQQVQDGTGAPPVQSLFTVPRIPVPTPRPTPPG